MTYPNSSDVSAGQPTAAAHYNNLRKDSLFFGQASTDSKAVGDFFARYAANLPITYLATNRLRVAYTAYHPPVIVIGGCMLQSTADVDLPAGTFSGAAAAYYVHAIRTPNSTTFTLSVNTTPTDNDTSRVIGAVFWDGANITAIYSWYVVNPGIPTPNYDSGWFACVYNTTYTKVHGLLVVPKLFILLHSATSDGTGEIVPVYGGQDNSDYSFSLVGLDSANAYITTNVKNTGGCVRSTRRTSAGGYYRLLCWI